MCFFFHVHIKVMCKLQRWKVESVHSSGVWFAWSWGGESGNWECFEESYDLWEKAHTQSTRSGVNAAIASTSSVKSVKSHAQCRTSFWCSTYERCSEGRDAQMMLPAVLTVCCSLQHWHCFIKQWCIWSRHALWSPYKTFWVLWEGGLPASVDLRN